VQNNEDGSGSDDDSGPVIEDMDEELYFPEHGNGPEYEDLPLSLPNKIENLHIQGARHGQLPYSVAGICRK
jgi:hypothetical protein